MPKELSEKKMGDLLVKFGKPHRILFLHKRTDSHEPTTNKHEGTIHVLVARAMFCTPRHVLLNGAA